MKKTAVVLFILIMSCVSLIGCSNANEQSASQSTSVSSNNTVSTKPEEKNTEPSIANTVTAAAEEIPFAQEVKGYSFKHDDSVIGMGQKVEPILTSLGKPINVFESPSCAFEGIDRIYYYNGFELFTYPINNVDYVLSVNITDDSVETSEGVYLGMTLEDIKNVYGEPDSQEGGLYKYASDGTSLSFIVEDEFVTAITYNFIVE